MTGDAVGPIDGSARSTGATAAADGSAESTGATKVEEDTDLDGVTIEFVGDATAASLSVPRASWERLEEEVAPMGSEGSTKAEVDSKRTGVREKIPEVSTSSKPTGSEEEGSATLGCVSVGAGVGVGAASCATMLMIFRSIKH